MELHSLTLLMLSVFNFPLSLSLSISSSSYILHLRFSFSDHLFDQSSSNSSVYEVLTKDIILAALNGFNGIQIQFKLFLFY